MQRIHLDIRVFDYTGNGNEKHELSHKMFNKTFAIIVIAKFILFTNSCNSAYIGIPVKLIHTWTPMVNSWHDIDYKVMGQRSRSGSSECAYMFSCHISITVGHIIYKFM